jgi:hypothetical protein
MKTRPWYYLVELHYHDNTDCKRRRPNPSRKLMKMWGTGGLPRCEECQKLDAEPEPYQPNGPKEWSPMNTDHEIIESAYGDAIKELFSKFSNGSAEAGDAELKQQADQRFTTGVGTARTSRDRAVAQFASRLEVKVLETALEQVKLAAKVAYIPIMVVIGPLRPLPAPATAAAAERQRRRAAASPQLESGNWYLPWLPNCAYQCFDERGVTKR